MGPLNLFKWRYSEAEIILLYERWYLRYSLSYRNLNELMAEWGPHDDLLQHPTLCARIRAVWTCPPQAHH